LRGWRVGVDESCPSGSGVIPRWHCSAWFVMHTLYILPLWPRL
jgi:hypothetical protein